VRLSTSIVFVFAIAAGCAAGTIQPNGNRDLGSDDDRDLSSEGPADLAGYDLTGFDLTQPPVDFAGVDLTGTCVHECNPNTMPKRCQPGSSVTVETCAVGVAGCYVWTQAMTCPNGGSCTGNGTCMTGCTNGQTRCGVGNAVETCTNNAWTFTQSCPFGCMIGGGGAASCVTSVSCTPGQTRCNGNGVEVCNASGTAWLTQATCANGCSGGLCTGGCTSGQKRCNANKVETCNGAGTAWTVTSDCAAGGGVCDIASATCAVSSLTIDATAQKDYNGVLVVNGPLVVKNGQTMTSTSGDLTIRATSITVEQGAAISVSATGATPAGSATNSTSPYNGGCGGGNGESGTGGYSYTSSGYCTVGNVLNSNSDAIVSPGGRGGQGGGGTAGGNGGGVLRLIADTIVIQGTLRADGQQGTNTSSSYGASGGGAGGGILIAADNVTIDAAATVSAAGGSGGINNSNPSYYQGGAGGKGRVKILSGASRTVAGTIVGVKTEGLLPPLTITSSTHPDPTLIYNDDFQSVALSWNRAFPSRQGYWAVFNTNQFQVPAPGAGIDYILGNEVKSYDRSKLTASLPQNGLQSWYFHVAPENASSVTGTVENNFRVQVSTAVPTIATPTHPNNTQWYADTVSTSWSFPSLSGNTLGDANWKGVYYVFDQYGDTVPQPGTATFAPYTKKTQTFSPVANGLWVMHVVTVDQMGYLTKKAAHALVRVWASGTPPAVGAVQGGVTQGGSPVNGAKVSLNRGLIPFVADGSGAVVTSGAGTFTIPNVPPGTYQLRAILPNGMSKEVMVTVMSGVTADTNVSF
jgi:hypothetical protein